MIRVCFLTPELFAELISPCLACAFWEIDTVRRLSCTESEARSAKIDWITAVERDWGRCGQIATFEGRPIGYLIYAPPALVPGTASFPTAPISADAVQLTTVWVDPDHRRRGAGRALIQGAVKDLLQRKQGAAIEAIASHGPLNAALGAQCVAGEEFFHRVGFKTVRPHSVSPRVRLDFRTVLTWREGIEGAVERVRGVIRPGETPMPQPASHTEGLGHRSDDR